MWGYEQVQSVLRVHITSLRKESSVNTRRTKEAVYYELDRHPIHFTYMFIVMRHTDIDIYAKMNREAERGQLE